MTIIGVGLSIIVMACALVALQTQIRLANEEMLEYTQTLLEQQTVAASPSRREKIEEILNLIRDHNPDLSPMVKHCFQQLTDFDNRRQQLADLTKIRNTSITENLEEELGKVENEVLQNMEDIISICIAAGATARGSVKWKELNTKEIDQEFMSNQTKFNMIDELLERFVISTNQHDGSFANLSLDAWIKVIDNNAKNHTTNEPEDKKVNTA